MLYHKFKESMLQYNHLISLLNVKYLVRYKAVQRSDWSKVSGLHLAQVGQQ